MRRNEIGNSLRKFAGLKPWPPSAGIWAWNNINISLQTAGVQSFDIPEPVSLVGTFVFWKPGNLKFLSQLQCRVYIHTVILGGQVLTDNNSWWVSIKVLAKPQVFQKSLRIAPFGYHTPVASVLFLTVYTGIHLCTNYFGIVISGVSMGSSWVSSVFAIYFLIIVPTPIVIIDQGGSWYLWGGGVHCLLAPVLWSRSRQEPPRVGWSWSPIFLFARAESRSSLF